MSSLENFLASATTTGDYKVLKVLGSGFEGTVYLVRDNVTRDRLVVKRFHEPRPCAWPALQTYASAVTPNSLGLPNIRLLVEADRIEGVCYPWIPLYPIHHRVLAVSDRMRQTIIGAFCRMQHYLMSQLRIGLWDTYADNFLLDMHGRWHYTDFGWGISPLDHPRFLDQGFFGYGFANLLLSLYGVNIKLVLLPLSGYRYDQPCVYWMIKELGTLGNDHAWIRDLVSEVRRHPASIFLAPEFYQQLGRDFPDQVVLPSAAISASLLLRQVGLLRKMVKRV